MLDSFAGTLQGLPVSLANNITIVLFIVLLLLMWTLFPKQQVMSDAPDQRWWRDLRIWGTLVICVQLGIYTLFQ